MNKEEITMNTNETPTPQPCTYTVTRTAPRDLEQLLESITTGQTPMRVGDMIGIELLDGTPVDLVVTDAAETFVRFESRDSLPAHTSARGLREYLDGIYDRLPEALAKRIAEVERVHLDEDGKRQTRRCKIFCPAASEIFPPDECYGDKGVYAQLPYYRDVHNRVRSRGKGGDAYWYWTSSRSAFSSSFFCTVNNYGSASAGIASGASGVAPFGCILPVTP